EPVDHSTSRPSVKPRREGLPEGGVVLLRHSQAELDEVLEEVVVATRVQADRVSLERDAHRLPGQRFELRDVEIGERRHQAPIGAAEDGARLREWLRTSRASRIPRMRSSE